MAHEVATTIKPHHFLDYMYEIAAFNGQFNPVMDSGASYGYYGTLIAAGKIDTVTFTTGADYNKAKVMVWDDLESLTPICPAEVVK